MNRLRVRQLSSLVFVLTGCFGPLTYASGQVLDRGEINGTVRDESGAVLPGVTVRLQEAGTGFERRVLTNRSGQFVGVLLPVGRYELRAERTGFLPATSRGVTLRVGEALTVDLMLTLAGVTATLDIQGRVDSSAGGPSGVFERNAVANLPINGRDYRDFALLAPTAHPTTGTRGTFRLGGQPGDYLALHVDGTDFTNNFFGEFFGSLETRNFSMPLEAVQEFRVTIGGAGAEFGRSNGGLVNVVTRSGSNAVVGSGAYFLRHNRLTAADAFGNLPTGLVRHQFGGSVGGPLARDRLFYFGAVDLQRQDTPITVKFARDVTGVAVPELGIQDLATLGGQFTREEDVTTALIKVDAALTRDHRLSSRGSYTRTRGTNQGGGSTILTRAVSNLESFRNQGLSWVTSLTSAFSSQVFAEGKFQFAKEDRPRDAQGDGPQIQINDTGSFGRSSVLPATQDMFRFQASGNVSYLAGRHLWKAGADYNGFNMRNNSFALARNGAYTFPTLERFLQRNPSLYGQNFGLGGVTAEEAALLRSFWQHELAVYIQDQYRPTANLTIGFGLRYDAQINPTPLAATAGERVAVGKPRKTGIVIASVPQDVPDDRNNWGPRAEVTYDPRGNGRTLLRTSAGLYYGRTPMIYFPVRGSGVTNTTIFAPPQLFGVRFPTVLPDTIPPGSALEALIPRPAIHYVDPEFQNPRVLTATASTSRQLADGWTVELGYLFSDSRNLRIGGFRTTLWDRNLHPPTTFDQFGRGTDILAAGRPDSTITQANALGSFGRGRYNALVVDLRKATAGTWQFSASYTLSKSEGNASTERDTEALLGPSDPFDLDADFGINELDVRHSFKSYFMARLPHGLFAASTWMATSGLAFPVYSLTDLNGDGVSNGGLNPDRPLLAGRPAPRFPFHQPPTFVWNLRMGKAFGLGQSGTYQLILELFNLMNTANKFSDPRTNAIAGQPNFRELNRTQGPRIAQIGIRLDF